MALLIRAAVIIISEILIVLGLPGLWIMVATTVKWAGTVEASPVRHAHLLGPGDWIVCAQSSVRDLSPPYAMFFTGDKLVHYRIAVEVDDCRRAPYAPATALAYRQSASMKPSASSSRRSVTFTSCSGVRVRASGACSAAASITAWMPARLG